MTFNSALSSGQIDILRGTGAAIRSWAADQQISICPNTTVLACQVNGTVVGGPFAQFNYDTVTTGPYTNVELDQTILISHVSDWRQAYYRGRIRVVPTNSILYISETSVNLTDNDYVWVIDHYDAIDRLARPVGDPPVQYKDYDVAYAAQAPVVTGLQTVYQGDSSAATNNGLRIAFSVSAYSPVPGRTISSYQFSFKAATYTVVSGSLASNTVTVDIVAGWQWGKLVVTDSAGLTWTNRFAIAVDTYTDGFEGARISGALEGGWTASVTGFTGLSNVLDGTFCIVGRPKEYYNATSQRCVANSIDFCGWLKSESNRGQSDSVYSFSKDVSFEIEGFGAVMQRLEMQALATRLASSPSVWDELANCAPWRTVIHALQRHSTIANLASIASDDTSDTYVAQYLSLQGDSLINSCNGVLSSINSALEFAPDGRIQMTRNAWHLSQTARDALTVIANFTNEDLLSIEESSQHWDTTGKIDSDGAFYNSTTGTTVELRARAPGYAQGYASGSGALNGQILAATADQGAAQTELNLRSGNELTVQNPNIDLVINMPDGYYWLIPSMGQVYTWTLDGSENVRGLVYTTSTKWVCVRVDHSHDNATGARSVQATFRLLPAAGDPGDTVPIIADGQLDNPLPDLPALDAFPALPEDNLPESGLLPTQIAPNQDGPNTPAPTNGNGVIVWNASKLALTRTYKTLTSPLWFDVTPTLGSYSIKDAIFDPFYSPYTAPSSVGGYALISDGTNSAVDYTSNIFAGSVAWVDGASFSGVYDQIKPCSTNGAVLIYSLSDNGVWTLTYDFTSSDYSFVAGDGLGGGGTYSAGVGWVSSPGGGYNHVRIYKLWGGTYTVSTVTVYITFAVGAPTGAGNSVIYSYDGVTTTTLVSTAGSGVTSPYAYGGPDVNIQGILVDILASNPAGANCTVTKIVVTGNGASPSGGAGNAAVRYSSDNGATFSSGSAVGTGPGAAGGFDVIQVGSVVMAAADKQVRISTSLSSPSFSNAAGGTLSTAQPVLIKIPRLNWSNASNINTSTPAYLLGTDALEAGACLWKVTGAGTRTDITPPSCTAIIGPEAAAVWWQNSNYIAVLGTKGGVTHLFTTVDGGTNWTDRGTFAGAVSVKRRAGNLSSLQLFFDGGSTLRYSKTGGVSTATRTAPGSSLLGIEVLG